ncbi:MAG: 16S rRNA (cytidine(1402)-2'-O)-methyltransferase [Candidatus Marinimicrobia bacterium]|nr:16S rRNA (cytidine(1402)-2'-O)-methyltransferase [Candidatus Neomarinimicrobiota bacterium]
MAGSLYIVSTPIGNLQDFTKRSIEILKDVDLVAAEDTRVTKKIFNHYNIKNSIISYNDYNENQKYQYLLEVLKSNKDIALVSDAGTPCISDPGYRIVNAANMLGINVVSVPGPSSVIAALSVSGLPSDSFYFEGFLPKKKGRTKRLNYLKQLDCTIVIFESPKRLLKTLNDILSILGNRVVSLCKELTKLHENVKLGYLNNIIKEIDLGVKGEYVVLIAKQKYSIDE